MNKQKAGWSINAAAPVLRGVADLTVTAVRQTAQMVEGMHANISPAVPNILSQRDAKTWGITGFVYKVVQAVTASVGWSIDQLLSAVNEEPARLPHDEKALAVLSAINGVVGDYLALQQNPLAITMQLRSGTRPVLKLGDSGLQADVSGKKLLIAIHGLCMNDQQWAVEGHNPVEQLAEEQGYTPLYLIYNSGRHISENGADFAQLMATLVQQWPDAIEDIVIVGHSMGGLISRSAIAQSVEQDWPTKVSKLICLGTPHHGAPLERGGIRLQKFVEMLPYVAPLARLGMIRSAGVTDLRHGNLLEADWSNSDQYADETDSRSGADIPENLKLYAVAGEIEACVNDEFDGVLGDGLVPVSSAFGERDNPSKDLKIPKARRAMFNGLNHFELLRDDAVWRCVNNWVVE